MLLPLAVSDAFIAGAAAILGGVVGATAGGLVDLFLECRREKATARAGARLIAADLTAADTALKSVESDDKWWVFFDTRVSAWDEYRNVLAVRLSNEGFEAVSDAVIALNSLTHMLPIQRDEAEPYGVLSEPAIKQLGTIRDAVGAAYNALARLAGHDAIEDTIKGAVTEADRAKARADDERRGTRPTSA